ncbi:recombinase family protein [Dyadobacter sp. CY351]
MHLHKGDVVIVWTIHRLSLTTFEVIKVMIDLKEMRVDFQSILEEIVTYI